MEDINLHFTGDIHAVSSAHNLLSAMMDAAMFHRTVDVDVRQIRWRRVMDMNDRALRQIVMGLGGRLMGVPREEGFDITAASEVMAILALTSGPADLIQRLSRIVLGYSSQGEAVTADQIHASEAMAIVLKDALKPNLVQTVEGIPAFIHAGPFGNIAHGCNSILATRLALGYADYVVTEAGFGFDLGGEKFLNIKCREAESVARRGGPGRNGQGTQNARRYAGGRCEHTRSFNPEAGHGKPGQTRRESECVWPPADCGGESVCHRYRGGITTGCRGKQSPGRRGNSH